MRTVFPQTLFGVDIRSQVLSYDVNYCPLLTFDLPQEVDEVLLKARAVSEAIGYQLLFEE